MIVLLGVNHKTAPLAIREQLAIGQGGKSYEETLEELRRLDGCRECYLLSTCNRVEIIVVVQENKLREGLGRADIESRIASLLFGDAVAPERYWDYLYVHRDNDAVHHLFMVATSLDSMVIGEAQILGQLKEAYRCASEGKGTGPILNKLLHKAFSTAKRVRTETLIGASAVSISYAAVELARKIFGSLQAKSVLLIGAGEMAELAAERLVSQGVDKVVVANRTLSRATSLAQRFHGYAVSLDELPVQLEQVDIVISSTGAPHLILQKQEMKTIMRTRRNEPIFFIDIAVPRDLDPALNELDNVYLYDIDDLHQVVEVNKSEREKEAVKARRIVDEETARFQLWLEGLAVVPTITALRKKANDISQLEIEKTRGRLAHLSLEDHQVIEKMALAITAKLLHAPISYLKDEGCKDQHDEKVEMIRTAFGLEDK
jgi:glutamyl-tRNA reductase